jgi:flagella basal body P-ring formation protein FlgA
MSGAAAQQNMIWKFNCLLSFFPDNSCYNQLGQASPKLYYSLLQRNMQEGFSRIGRNYMYKRINKTTVNSKFFRFTILTGYSVLATFVFMTSIFCHQACSKSAHSDRDTIVYKYAQRIQKGDLIDGGVIRGARIPESQAPTGAIDTGEIALGRPVLRTVESGQIILFSDCFTPEQLRLKSRIDVIQGTSTMRKHAADNKTQPSSEKKVKALFCRHKIEKGHIMEPSDVTLKLVPLMQLPVSQVVDIWTVYNRRALHNIEAGERLLLEDVVPIDQMTRLKESYSKS